MLVAAYLDIAIRYAIHAIDLCLWRYHSLRQQRQSLSRLECRAWRLRLADGLAYITPRWRVSGHAEYLAVSRIDGYDSARLTLQQPSAQLL